MTSIYSPIDVGEAAYENYTSGAGYPVCDPLSC
jgi:hypothetical protein